MDILSHTLTGVAVGTVMASFSEGGFGRKATIIGIAGLGGALPDFDAISLWSKFDQTIGQWLGLKLSGANIYFNTLWYSHHGALHSITLAFLIPLLFFLIGNLIKRRVKPQEWRKSLQKNKLLVLGFALGFTCHLLEDMPTPHCVWGGVRFFFPSPQYMGGFGKIWWWNNYDLFLIIVTVIVLNLLLLAVIRFLGQKTKWLTSSIFLIGVSLFLYQINSRSFDFNYRGFTSKHGEYERKSMDIQREILGEELYSWMEKLDNCIPLNF